MSAAACGEAGRSPAIRLYRYLVLPLVPILLVVVGTLGYYLLEQPDYTLFDALYMTVTTLTTVGYQEVHPLHTEVTA